MPKPIIDPHNFLFYNANDVSLKDYIMSQQQPYTIHRSNYTHRYICGSIDITLMTTKQPPLVFACYNKIKSDIVKQNIAAPDIENDHIIYFNFNIPAKIMNRPFPVIYNTDLTSAYSTILANEKIISKDTIRLIGAIPKLSRLVCVGMLASRKDIEDYDQDGKLVQFATDKNPLSSFFFLCVQKTGEIISRCEQAISNDFIFSWVDGIYYFSESSHKTVAKILTDLNLKFKQKAYYDFICRETYGGAKKITFRDDRDGPLKTFLLPEKKQRNFTNFK
jgi:hypothetical protein